MMSYADWLSLMLIYLKLTEQITWGWHQVIIPPIIAAIIQVKLGKQ